MELGGGIIQGDVDSPAAPRFLDKIMTNKEPKIHVDKIEYKELERIPVSKWDKQNNGAAEGLSKKIGYWQQKDLDITIAQAINLAQNHALKQSDYDVTEDYTFDTIERLYPKYLELLLEAKRLHNPKEDEKSPF